MKKRAHKNGRRKKLYKTKKVPKKKQNTYALQKNPQKWSEKLKKKQQNTSTSFPEEKTPQKWTETKKKRTSVMSPSLKKDIVFVRTRF